MTDVSVRSRGVPAAEIDVDIALVKQLLREQHPDLADQPLILLDIGWDNFMFRLGAELTVRLPRRSASAALLAGEQTWLPVLAPGLSLPVPAPHRIGQPSGLFPWHWSILPWFPGVPAAGLSLSREQARLFAQFLRELHQPAPETAPRSAVRGTPLQLRAAAINERMERLRGGTTCITPGIEAIWQRALSTAPSDERRWLHGDLHALNVLVDEGRISAVIDWGDMTAGDAATDLASTWMLFDAPEARRELLARYSPSASELTRGLGWAVGFGVMLLDAGLVNSPRLAGIGRAILERLDYDYDVGVSSPR